MTDAAVPFAVNVVGQGDFALNGGDRAADNLLNLRPAAATNDRFVEAHREMEN
jgi:hypothetical protein